MVERSCLVATDENSQRTQQGLRFTGSDTGTKSVLAVVSTIALLVLQVSALPSGHHKSASHEQKHH